uniref:Putative metalloproteinase n=2 Tax=Tityus serrulatus TaxID=6887 RepID=A0A218QX04_TITSE
MTQHGRRAHLVEELLRDEDSYLADSIVIPDFKRQTENYKGISKEDQCIVIEFLCATESKFTERFKSNQALTEYVILMYAGAEILIRGLDLGIKFRLTGIQAYTKVNEPAFIKENELANGSMINGNNVIRSFGNYVCKNLTGLSKKADIAMLIVTRTMTQKKPSGVANAAGLAYYGKVCDECHKVGATVDKSRGLNTITTLAHEIAHLLGVPHDGESIPAVPGSPGAESCSPKEGYIMGTTLAHNMTKFSKCSKESAKYLLS